MNSVTATLKFLENIDQDNAYVASVAGGEVADHPGDYVEKSVSILDGRRAMSKSSLDHEGFLIYSHPVDQSLLDDDTYISGAYQHSLEQLIGELTGASSVYAFDHTRRSTSERIRKSKSMREHASVVHNDYTDSSGPKRLKEILPDRYASLGGKRFAIINLWRPTNGRVENYPLALCDCSSLDSNSDLVTVQRKSADRVGEIQLVKFNPQQRWVYYPDMGVDEVLIFKTYDSAAKSSARFTVHSAFDDPNAPRDAMPRESIETRCFVFY